jgi:phosphoglucosamine mutase
MSGRKYFGTDGVRGVVPSELTPEFALRLGMAAAAFFKLRGRSIVLGTDTRISADTVKAALVAGLTSCGATVLDAGVVPTPAVSFLTTDARAGAGVVISASHNPYEYNGIKFFSSDGYKLSDSDELRIEEILDAGIFELAPPAEVGRWVSWADAAHRYAAHIAGTVGRVTNSSRIVIDCANGATGESAMLLAKELGIDADFVCTEPDGTNINRECGATHTDRLRSRVVEGGYGGGVAFDGDGDRVIFVDENGEEINGDHIIAFLAATLKREGRLANDVVVATVLSNLGLEAYLNEIGVRLERSAVGDRYVLEKMIEVGSVLGGEQSGHIILLEEARTGDGLLVFAQVVKRLWADGDAGAARFSSLRLFEMYPQVQLNIRTERKNEVETNEAVRAALEDARSELGSHGRVIVRPSGTEPLVRVMVEARDKSLAERVAQSLVAAISAALS